MKDLTEGKLDEELKFAIEIGTNSLQKCISSLKQVDELYHHETKLMNDFAPHSFYFERTSPEKGIVVGNGGIIFHDVQKGLGTATAPSFSVSVDSDSNPHWQIHT